MSHSPLDIHSVEDHGSSAVHVPPSQKVTSIYPRHDCKDPRHAHSLQEATSEPLAGPASAVQQSHRRTSPSPSLLPPTPLLSQSCAPQQRQHLSPFDHSAAAVSDDHLAFNISRSNTESTLSSSYTSGSNSASVDTSAPPLELMQHCLLFPTYATRHSRSGSKDPLDWNIRVRGWAFSKRWNRRKRLVMSMARKIAGVTKDDNKVLETLESRFGMFLTSNTRDARFSIQCVGLASTTTRMELAGGSEGDGCHDPTVDVLMDELETTDGVLAAAAAVEEKRMFRKSLELLDPRGEFFLKSLAKEQSRESEKRRATPLQHAAVTALKPEPPVTVKTAEEGEERADHGSYQEDTDGLHTLEEQHRMAYRGSNTEEDIHAHQVGSHQETPEREESTFTGRLSKGAAIIRGAIRRVKPTVVMSQLGNNSSSDSIKSPHQQHPLRSQLSTVYSKNSIETSTSVDLEASGPNVASRAQSGASVEKQTSTTYEDLGRGEFPTVHISSQPGGHFSGTLRMSHEEVEVHRCRQRDLNSSAADADGHPKFLRLHAYHRDRDILEPSHGIVNLIEPEGISIISDIDDTIKETNVTAGARIILRNTFLRDMREVDGMAAVYKSWWNRGAAIHYVSNSPWQLIPSLLDFFHTHMFPPGSAHLRMHDSVLKTYFTTPGENKRRCIEEILTDFPDRKFILVGDSGEIDLEIYTEMAVAHPRQILKIFIRDITTARLRDMAAHKMAPSRSRSFSSLRLSKASPITAAVSSGFGLFSRRGSQVNSALEPNNGSTSNLSTISNMDLNHAQEGDDVQEQESTHNNDHTASSQSELSEDENHVDRIAASRHGGLDYHGGPLAPRLDPSGPLKACALPPATLATSPQLEPMQTSVPSVKAGISSNLSSAFMRPPGGKKSGSSYGWSAIRGRVRSSPGSPLTESASALTGYPFPPSATPLSQCRHDSADEADNRSEDQQHHDYFGVHGYHSHMVFEQQRRQRTCTSSSANSTTPPTMSPASGPTPSHTPPMSPGIPIRGVRGGSAGTSGGAAIVFPGSTSPSGRLKPSSPSSSPSQTSTSARTPLDVWLDRVDQCRKQLREGVLTLFESADELEDCDIVQDMFKLYGEEAVLQNAEGDGGEDAEEDAADGMEMEAGSVDVPGLMSSCSSESVSTVDTNGLCCQAHEGMVRAQPKQHWSGPEVSCSAAQLTSISSDVFAD
ncbi:unnamed protein product [Mortierella alpina]